MDVGGYLSDEVPMDIKMKQPVIAEHKQVVSVFAYMSCMPYYSGVRCFQQDRYNLFSYIG